jgi:hypothetical protein
VPRPPDARRIAWQVAVFCVAVLLVLWKAWLLLPGPREHKWIRAVLVTVAAAVTVWSVGWPRPKLEDLGLARRHAAAGWGAVSLFTLACLAGLALLAWIEGTTLAWDRARWVPRYVLGAAGQQVLLQVFLTRRVHEATGGSVRATVAWATGIMVALHAPNPALCAAVLFATPFWVWHFLRHRNLYAVASCHAALGCAAMFFLGKGPLLNLRVGLGALDLLLR